MSHATDFLFLNADLLSIHVANFNQLICHMKSVGQVTLIELLKISVH